jgi:hypothetical protein
VCKSIISGDRVDLGTVGYVVHSLDERQPIQRYRFVVRVAHEAAFGRRWRNQRDGFERAVGVVVVVRAVPTSLASF